MGGKKTAMQGGFFYGDQPLEEVRATDQFNIRVRELVEGKGLDPETARSTAVAELADVPEVRVREDLAPSTRRLAGAFGVLVSVDTDEIA